MINLYLENTLLSLLIPFFSQLLPQLSQELFVQRNVCQAVFTYIPHVPSSRDDQVAVRHVCLNKRVTVVMFPNSVVRTNSVFS